MSQREIRIAGFGGQGVILCGMILGRAATIYADRFATLTQSFGPEARGGACAVQVIVADKPVLYPYVTSPDILAVMSQEAAGKFVQELRPGATLIVEEDLVSLKQTPEGVLLRKVPATRLAEEIGPKIVQNIVMVGFITAVTGLLPVDAVRQSIRRSVPEGTETINLMAFERGYRYGMEHYKAD